MKVTVERAALLKSLGHVHRVVERRNTIPILSNVLLRAETDGLRLKATDLDIEVTETVPADVPQPGATTVPAHMIYDIVRKLPEGAQVSIEVSDTGTMQIRSGRSRFTLQTLPEADFPDLAAGDLPHRFVLSASDLKRLIDKTQFAISTEETRYYLNGIYLHAIESGAGELALRAVATDGHRLARIEMTAPPGAEGMPGVIVPRKAVGEIQKLIEDGGASIEIELSPAKIRLTFSGETGEGGEPARGVVLTTKLIDGTFPDYQRVIPTGNDKRLTVEREDFAKAVDRVSTISSERGRAVKLTLGDGRLTLTVNNPDSGNAVEELDAEYDAVPLDIGFNARYLLDIAAQLEGDTATFRLADPGSPTLIQDGEGAPALYVLMPMRV
jgi:DNA polymerase III subunit beta